MRGNLSLLNKTRANTRGIPFLKIKEKVLGKKYVLSVALLGSIEMRRAMRYKKPRQVGITTRASKKDKVSNVLAFPLSKHSGEILLCPAASKPYSLTYLFIHGCLHLKGLSHGGTMESAERRLLEDLPSFTHAKNSNRNRRRLVSR